MFLDFILLFYDDFLDIIPSKIRKILAVILLTIGALFIISYSMIDDDFLEVIALLIGILLVLVGLVTFFHNSISGETIITNEDSNEVVEQKKNNSALPWLIGSVSTLAFILVASVIFLWLRSVADEILIGGPPPTLTGWEQSYQELTGFDEVSGLDGSGVVVCVVDSGIEMSHPDLKHLTLTGWFDVINGQNEPYDDEGHGTAMAGIIVAKNGLSGNAQGVDLLVAKAIDSNGEGTDTGIAEAVDWCADNQADIISLSLGGEGGISIGGITTDQLENAVQDALEQGIFVVAAAGNDGGQDDDGDVSSPGSVEDVICVGGATRLGNVWSGSSEGDNDGRLWPPMLPRSDPDMKPEVLGPGAEVPLSLIHISEPTRPY